ncbi:hypothetical protein HT136_00920 [Novosphingobium profundi]|uniref:hypothetical protein n=1 Tax=Novosphingobium profundi TaxID=1774954 RepID=UPI001BDAD37B|nr:hypothetical protein [Novosphingobium profundi]MBT0666931.1 hypothetical protein [Novosphingobium profundi]
MPAFFLLVVIALCRVSALRDPVIDEFWTMLFTEPNRTWSAGFAMWSGDTGHPPAYYALMRALAGILPQSVLFGRLANLLPLGLFLALASAQRGREHRRFAFHFCLALLPGFFVVEYFAEQRAYFAALMVLASLVLVLRGDFVPVPSRRRTLGAALLACTLAALNYTQFLAGVAVLGGCVVAHCRGRRRQAALGTLLVLACGLLVMIACLRNGARFETVPSPYRIDMAGFGRDLAMVIALACLANPLLTIRTLRRPAHDGDGAGGFAFAMALGLLFAVLGYTLVNLATHVLIERHVIALGVLVAALLAALVQDRLGEKSYWPHALVVTALASLSVACLTVAGQRNFTQAVPHLVARQKACPQTRIFALDPSVLGPPPQSANARQRVAAIASGYAWTQAHRTLKLEPPGAPRTFPEECGGAVWMAHLHLAPDTDPRDILEKLGFRLAAWQAHSARLMAFPDTVIIAVPGRARSRELR